MILKCKLVGKLFDLWVDFVFGKMEEFEYTGSTTPYEERKAQDD